MNGAKSRHNHWPVRANAAIERVKVKGILGLNSQSHLLSLQDPLTGADAILTDYPFRTPKPIKNQLKAGMNNLIMPSKLIAQHIPHFLQE